LKKQHIVVLKVLIILLFSCSSEGGQVTHHIHNFGTEDCLLISFSDGYVDTYSTKNKLTSTLLPGFQTKIYSDEGSFFVIIEHSNNDRKFYKKFTSGDYYWTITENSFFIYKD